MFPEGGKSFLAETFPGFDFKDFEAQTFASQFYEDQRSFKNCAVPDNFYVLVKAYVKFHKKENENVKMCSVVSRLSDLCKFLKKTYGVSLMRDGDGSREEKWRDVIRYTRVKISGPVEKNLGKQPLMDADMERVIDRFLGLLELECKFYVELFSRFKNCNYVTNKN